MNIDIKKDNPDVKRIFDENRTALETLARRCNELNARFVVVSPPCMSSDAHRIALREELLSVLENLPYLVEYQNLNAKIWEGIFEADDFYNEELLNEYGAKKFTQILNELCSLEEEGVTG